MSVTTKRRPWTAEELETLRRLLEEGASVYRASVVLNRPLTSVRIKARELGMPFPSKFELLRKRRASEER